MSVNPIIEAIYRKDVPTAMLLIDEGKYVNEYDVGREELVAETQTVTCRRAGRTPLIVAAEAGVYECICRLLERKAKVDLKERSKVPPFKRTALSYAAEKGHWEIIRKLLEAGADPNSKDDNLRDEVRGKTPLHYAAENGHLEAVRLLVEFRANPNSLTKCGYSSALLAMDQGHSRVVNYLLELGVDVTVATDHGWDILKSAISNTKADVEIVAALLKNGANVNGQAGLHSTPLMEAILKHRLDIVEMLVCHGADVNKGKSNGFTPLMYAVLSQNWEACEILLRENANVESCNRNGETAGQIAEKEGTEGEFRVVLERARIRRQSA